MEFRILGPLEVLEGGDRLSLGGAKQRALLAVLLVHANEPVSTDRLIDELWAERPPATAAHTLQVYVSNLRKVLGAERLVTRAPGYLAEVGPDELDLERFERLFREGRDAVARGAADIAGARLCEALSLWRGAPLADFAYEPFAQAAIARLGELRLVALEERIEADIAGGRHGELIGELQTLVGEHPLRERPRGQLMLALYRAGRQAEALEVFQQTRRLFVEELGIDPTPTLQQLERAILQQDPGLDWVVPVAATRAAAPERSILLAAEDESGLERLIAVAEPLALSRAAHELILAWALEPTASLNAATMALNERRAILSSRRIAARAAAFTSVERGGDVARLASEQDVDLVLLDGPKMLGGGPLRDVATIVLEQTPCDVALVFGREEGATGGGVLVPFGGADHDWAALELGAWCASARGVALVLLGTAADEDAGERDASRLLAHAALAVQQLTGVSTEPSLAAPGDQPVLEAAEQASLLVAGFPSDWRRFGLGATRTTLATSARPTTLLVRRGLRPGGLAPGDSLTSFTWSLSEGYAGPATARRRASA
jgi:DNA-binding SARP family transcriptional activator